jgi:hypothetical protein
VRTPPSQSESLPPRSGALLPPAPQPATGEPLSDAKTRSVCDQSEVARSAVVTLARVSSIAETIPDQRARSGLKRG